MIEGEIKVGDVYRYPDTHTHPYTRIAGPVGEGAWSVENGPTAAGPWSRRTKDGPSILPESCLRYQDRISALAPAASQHPADLKPRGVKAPLHLIPWGAVPLPHVPGELVTAASVVAAWPDGDHFDYPGREPGWLLGLACAILADLGLEPVARVFDYGAKKYQRNNWRAFTWDQAAEDAYFGAIFRHLCADARGETIDPESGQPHRAHAACGALISIWHYRYGAAGKRAEARPDV